MNLANNFSIIVVNNYDIPSPLNCFHMSLESIIPTLQERVQLADPLGSTLKFEFDEQLLIIDGTGEANTLTTENSDTDCTVKISLEDFQSLLSGDLNPMSAFMSGAIKIEGDMSIAMKLQSLFG